MLILDDERIEKKGNIKEKNKLKNKKGLSKIN